MKLFKYNGFVSGQEKPGDRSPPGPRKFISIGRGRGDPIFYQMGPFLTDIVLFFRQFSVFTYLTLWALLTLGALFRKGPKAWSPTSELISPGLVCFQTMTASMFRFNLHQYHEV